MKELNMIVRMHFGSFLYGTNTPESDQDYKGIFIPSKREVLLGHIPKSYNVSRKKAEGEKNTSDDVDIEIYSLHYFIKLACEGQTVALDMLHAPSSMIQESSYIWDYIVTNREKFYTKNLKAFVGYARRQSAKYCCKGSRLNALKEVIGFLEKNSDKILSDLWDTLPTGEHVYMIGKSPNGLEQYQVCGKIFLGNSKN